MNEDNIASRMAQRLWSHRVLFYWSVPVCFVVVYALMFCVPTTYQSQWSLVAERTDAADEYNTLTLNHPEQYDLGLAQTRNGIGADDYNDMVYSPQLLRRLLVAPVATIDGKFNGTYSDYINHYQRKTLLSKVGSGISRCFNGGQQMSSNASYAAEDIFFTREEANTIATIRKQITCTLERKSDIVRIEVVTQDPLVSAQVAKHIENELQALIENYYKSKAQRLTAHIDSLTAAAESDWKEAVRTQAKEADTYHHIYDSFRRQQVIYQAKAIVPKPFTALSEPAIVYTPVGPHRLRTTLLLTFVYALLVGAWICRKELIESLLE